MTFQLPFSILLLLQLRYSELIDMVDQMFPPMSSKSIDSSQSEYTAFSYWRAPLLPLDDLNEDEEFEFP